MALAVMELMESALPALMAAVPAEPMEARLGVAQRAAIIVREPARGQHTVGMALTAAAGPGGGGGGYSYSGVSGNGASANAGYGGGGGGGGGRLWGISASGRPGIIVIT